MPHRVFDMDFDEVSTVDVPANQHGVFVLAKRATNEETTVPDFYDADGNAVDSLDGFDVGDSIYDAEGNEFQVDLADADEPTVADELADAELGKSAFFAELNKNEDRVFAVLADELSKAATDEDREYVLSKAFAAQATELSKAQRQAAEAFEIAKAAQDRELERAYIAKASEYTLPVSPEELGPVMKRAEEALSHEDCLVLHKAFSGSSDMFDQLGFTTDADAMDPFAEIEAHANEVANELGKSADRAQVSKEMVMVDYFTENPEAYAALRRNQG